MKKGKIIVGNWKMNPVSPEEAKAIFTSTSRKVGTSKKVEVIICPSYIHLAPLAVLAKKSLVKIGSQNFFHEFQGSFTGEVSVNMVAKAGASFAIIGHSERRKLGETDDIVNRKVSLALKANLKPIVCIGEETRDEEGKYFSHIKNQIEKALRGITRPQLTKVIIAYEPVWAIGADAAMSARDVHEMTIFIKKTLVDLYKMKGKDRVDVPILYGGSVDPKNSLEIMTHGDADGLLIGRQSLVPESFLEVITLAQSIK
jgi:triosephosphate isomerase